MEETLQNIALQIADCKKCPLHSSRMLPVPGHGSQSAPIMMIGEKPGTAENKSGIPFVGESGQLLQDILMKAGLKRSDFFITNTLKCMPPYGTVVPVDHYITCEDWLDKQINLINPKIIVAVGTPAVSKFFPGERLGIIHGKPRRTLERILFPSYHPAAALRNADLLDPIINDFITLRKLVDRL